MARAMIRVSWILVTSSLSCSALTGCESLAEVVPPPAPGDCYVAERTANVDPAIGVGGTLHGRLVSAGCAEMVRAITAAKAAGVDIDWRDFMP